MVVFVGNAVIGEDLDVFVLGVVLGEDVDLYLVHFYHLPQVLVLLGEALVLEHEVVEHVGVTVRGLGHDNLNDCG